jgi:2,5-diketo-D-gluconate reductase B
MAEHTAPLPDGFGSSAFQHGFCTHWMDVDRDPSGHFVDVILSAVDAGYRRLDCNPVWDTERMVGMAIEQSSTPRDELFVTTVVPFDQLGEELTGKSIRSSLDRLGLEHLDAVFVSAPIRGWDIEGTAAGINSLVHDGIVAHVGGRYMCREDVDELREHLATPVFAHLTELHPLWPADDLRAHAVEHGYWIIADSPFMQGVVGEIREVRRAAARSQATPFQVTLAWLHHLDNVATSTWVHSPDLMAENLQARELELAVEAIDDIGAITRRWSGAPHLHPVSPN